MNKNYFLLNRIILVCTLLFALVACSDDRVLDDTGKIKVALRDAGHQLLMLQQDSTSIILPVVEIEQDLYQLSFQKDISILPNALVTVIDSSFTISRLPKNYRVEGCL